MTVADAPAKSPAASTDPTAESTSAASPDAHHPPSSREALDRAVADLQAAKGRWAKLSIDHRLEHLEVLAKAFAAVDERWVEACRRAEGTEDQPEFGGEEWLAGPYSVLRNVRLLHRALKDIRRRGVPRIPGPVSTLPNGQVSARVFPFDVFDRAFFPGVTAEVWMGPEVDRETLPETQALEYRALDAGEPGDGRVALVLGAGNVSSIGPMDALYKLFVENQVVLYKTHPVNDYLGPLLEEAFSDLIAGGFLRVVYGGAEEGQYLVDHAGVDEIHITGSDRTVEIIAFGPGEEGRRRKAAKDPKLDKPISSELGNVSPVIVVPGPWSESDLEYQAENIVSMLTNNAGFNCNATRVVVQWDGWDQRRSLTRKMQEFFARTPTRDAWYPGASERFESFMDEHPEAHRFGRRGEARLPWAFIPDLDPKHGDDICFNTEAFCSICGETALEAATPAEFLRRAAAFCNDTLWGTLNATVIVHPDTLADPKLGPAVEKLLGDLRYGTVSVNHWAAVGYALGVTPWGAYPGHELWDIQSGTGVVHNTLMFSRPQKAVVRSPFRAFPKPPWFVTHRTSRELAHQLSQFEADRSLLRLPAISWFALRG